MNLRRVTIIVPMLLLCFAASASARPISPQSGGTPLGTSFTFQGRLLDNGVPANGKFDLQFQLFDQLEGGTQIDKTVLLNVIDVREGLFSVALNFGMVFDGRALFLAVGVRPGNTTGAYTPLTPRQPITAVPYALALPGLRTEPNVTSANVIGGYAGNDIAAGTVGATIGGGGLAGSPNIVNANHGTIGGGKGNTAGGDSATIGGGTGNAALRGSSTVAGGLANQAVGEYSVVSGGATNRATDNYNTIGGGANNLVGNNNANVVDAQGATVGGGIGNSASGESATVGGGSENSASGFRATVAGGFRNGARGNYSVVAGGGLTDPGQPFGGNIATDDFTTVSGGASNLAGNGNDDTTDAQFATVGGGVSNVARGAASTVSGGSANKVSGVYATIGGGILNTAAGDGATLDGGVENSAAGYQAVVGGGYRNYSSNSGSTIGGGSSNNASGNSSTIAGGVGNRASEYYATVGGGINNAASGKAASIIGGQENSASGEASTVAGGFSNAALGKYSFAAGSHAIAVEDGTFVWADAYDAPGYGTRFYSGTTPNSFNVRATGGVYLYASTDVYGVGLSGVKLLPGSGSWSSISDRNAKTALAPIAPREILATVAALPIQTWQYRTQDASIRHIGPMAQDFHAAFRLGENDTTISTVDADGVALAAIQGLYQVTQEQAAQLGTQQQRIDSLESRIAVLEQRSTGNTGFPAAWATIAMLPLGALLLRRRGGQK